MTPHPVKIADSDTIRNLVAECLGVDGGRVVPAAKLFDLEPKPGAVDTMTYKLEEALSISIPEDDWRGLLDTCWPKRCTYAALVRLLAKHGTTRTGRRRKGSTRARVHY